jgi:ribosomal protein L40E
MAVTVCRVCANGAFSAIAATECTWCGAGTLLVAASA